MTIALVLLTNQYISTVEIATLHIQIKKKTKYTRTNITNHRRREWAFISVKKDEACALTSTLLLVSTDTVAIMRPVNGLLLHMGCTCRRW